jgi:hypothetical protein
VAAWAIAVPPANDSFSKPNNPLGSAAVMAIPAFIGLRKSSAHSSLVKLVLSAMELLHHQPVTRRREVSGQRGDL